MPEPMQFTPNSLNKLRAKKPEKQLTIWDTKQTGLCVLVSPGRDPKSATVTFRVAYYLKEAPGRPIYQKLGRYSGKADEIKQARSDAARIRDDAAKGHNPKRPKLADKPFEKVVDEFISDHAKNNRTWRETRRIFDCYVTPEWWGRRLEDIKRSDVMALLRKIAAGNIRHVVKRVEGEDIKVVRRPGGEAIGSAPSADAALAQVRKLMNWYALSTDDYRSPIVKGMRQGKPGRRERHLLDAEIRALWAATGQMGIFGASVRAMLLTAQRVKKVEEMRRSEVKDRFLIPGHHAEDGAWVPDEFVENVWDAARDNDPANKQVSVVPLSAAARAVIDSVPVVDAARGKDDFVFSLNGKKPINGRSKCKDRLDGLMLAAMRAEDPGIELRPWELRDLRRTARTLMARAGVGEDLAERCLGHVMPGVRGVYNRHDFIREKRIAFDKLAALVERIVSPPRGNVVALPARG
jgi:hypothetical protein